MKKDDYLYQFFQDTRTFLEGIIGKRIQTIDFYHQPILLSNSIQYVTDGQSRPFGNGNIIENYSIVIIALNVYLPPLSRENRYNVLLKNDFPAQKTHIGKLLNDWFHPEKHAPTVKIMVKQKIDEELDKLYQAIQNQQPEQVEHSKKQLAYYQELLGILTES